MELDKLNKEDLDYILAQCVTDIKSTCGIIFPEIFYSEFSILHQQIFDLINSGHKKIAIAAPRGIGKISIARAVVARAILFRLTNFIVYVSNSATSAEMQTENLKRDLIGNRMIRQLFGNIKESIDYGDVAGIDESFSKKSWTAFGSMFILPRGAGQQVRGLNWSNNRPGLIIIDDLEDKNEIQSKENREKLKDWFDSDLMKTEGKYDKGTIFIYIDTIKHEDSILVDLMNSPEWASIQLAICDQHYNTYDPNYMSTEEIKAEVEEHRRKGKLDLFYMERMNMPISLEDAIFKPDAFNYFDDLGDRLVVPGVDGTTDEVRNSSLIHVTIVDPAKTVKIQSAESAIVTIAVDRTSRKIFIRDIVSRKFYPDEIYDEMFRQVTIFKSYILGYEVTGLNEFIIQPIESECRVRNLYPLLIQLQARKGVNEKGKAERIKTLAPLYRLGYMYHNKNNCSPLEIQLLSFPRSKLWDVMDAVSYITHIMDSQSIYFDPDSDLSSDEENLDSEYDELLEEDGKGLSLYEMGNLI